MPRPHRSLAMPSSFQPSQILVHYNEVGLKGRNRQWFENRLVKNIEASLPGLKRRVLRLFGRLSVPLNDGADWRRVVQVLQRVSGVAYLLPATATQAELPALEQALEQALDGANDTRTFGIQCKRASKSLPFSSMEAARALGTFVQRLKGWPVQLDDPELAIRIELVNQQAFVAFERFEGPGGLPAGAGGRVACLLSGGIDSPVAAARLIRRGASPIYIHFHSYPHTGIESQEKVRELATRIHPPGREGRLYMVPFAELQRRIVAECPPSLRVILYRRFMLRAAERLAQKEHALALVTGDSLGQVASQTLENLRTIEAACHLPVLRPLVGLDKQEIVSEARRLGTYDVSVEPHDDCCSFFMPPRPATQCRIGDAERSEASLDVEAEVEELLRRTERILIRGPCERLEGEYVGQR